MKLCVSLTGSSWPQWLQCLWRIKEFNCCVLCSAPLTTYILHRSQSALTLLWLCWDLESKAWQAVNTLRLSESVDKHDYRCVGNVILAFRQCTIQHQAIIYDWPALIPSLILSATHYHCSESLCLLQWNYKPIIFLVGWVCACGAMWAIQALADSPPYLVQMAQKGKTMTDINAALQQRGKLDLTIAINAHWMPLIYQWSINDETLRTDATHWAWFRNSSSPLWNHMFIAWWKNEFLVRK